MLRESLKGIEHLGKRQAVPILRRTLRSHNRDLREFACISLGNLGGKWAMRLLIKTMVGDPSLKIRERAAHAISFFNSWKVRNEAYPQLRDVFVNSAEHPAVRAQAAEGIAYILDYSDRRRKTFREAEKLMLEGLLDNAPEVRFWSVFALAAMRSTKALPQLRYMAETDHVKCRNWWLVSEEASDSIARIEGRQCADRNFQWDGDYEDS